MAVVQGVTYHMTGKWQLSCDRVDLYNCLQVRALQTTFPAKLTTRLGHRGLGVLKLYFDLPSRGIIFFQSLECQSVNPKMAALFACIFEKSWALVSYWSDTRIQALTEESPDLKEERN